MLDDTSLRCDHTKVKSSVPGVPGTSPFRLVRQLVVWEAHGAVDLT